MSRRHDVGDAAGRHGMTITDVRDVGGGVRMLRGDPEQWCGNAWLFEHECPRHHEGGERVAPIVAIPLHPGHQIVNDDPLTITPSILCTICQLHGFVTDGVWRSA